MLLNLGLLGGLLGGVLARGTLSRDRLLLRDGLRRELLLLRRVLGLHLLGVLLERLHNSNEKKGARKII